MYNAFISYSHAADGKLAPALQTALEKFAKPWYKIRYLNIFRDEASLTASPHLWANIQNALERSEYLIYMASPASASSKWIIKEIEYWLTHKSIESLLIVLTDGEILWDDELNTFLNKDYNSLPDILVNKFTQEPFYIDLRTARTQEDVSLSNPIFKKEVLKIAAHLHGKQPKELASEEVFAHRKMILVRNAAILVLAFLLCIAMGTAWLANKNANEAKTNLLQAEKNQRRADSNAILANEQRDSAIIARRLANEQRDSAIIARRLANENAMIAKLQKDTAQIEKDKAIKQEGIAIEEKNKAQANYLISEAKSTVENDPTLALRLAEEAIEKNDIPIIEKDAIKIYRENSFYKIIRSFKSQISFVAFSPDGKTICTGSFLDTAYLLDLSGKIIKPFAFSVPLSCAAFSPDGKTIITGDWGDHGDLKGNISIWDDKGNLKRKFVAHYREILSIAFSPDGNTILSGSVDRSAGLWDLNGNLLQLFNGHSDAVTSVQFSADGKTVLTGSADSTVRLWNLQGKLLKIFAGHSDGVTSAAFSPDRKTILTGSGDSTARLWDLQGNTLQVFKGHSGVVNLVAFSPDGKTILTSSEDNSARLWTLNGNTLEEFKGHSNGVREAAFSPDGKTILTGSLDRTVRLWGLKTAILKEFKGHHWGVESVAFSPDEKNVLIGSLEKISIWGLKTNELITFYGSFNDFSANSVIRLNTKIITIGLDKKTVVLVDSKENKQQVFQGHNNDISAITVSADKKQILTGSIDKTARLWDLQGNTIQVFKNHPGKVIFVGFSADGKAILTGSEEKIFLWDFDGSNLLTFEGNFDNVYPSQTVFLPNGKAITFNSDSLTAFLLDQQGGKWQFKGHSDIISCFAISPDGNTIVTGSYDNTARLWDLQGNTLQIFKGHFDHIRSVAFSPNGKTILTGSNDGTARLWCVLMPLHEFLKSNNIEPLSSEQKSQFGIE